MLTTENALKVVVLSFLLVIASCASSSTQGPLPKNAAIFDVRSPGEFSAEHISGAKNIPYTEIEERLEEFPGKETPIVVYCRSGRRSGIAKNTLETAGFTNVTNGGGLSEMKQRIQASKKK